MILKKILRICENKGCYNKVSKSVVYLKNESTGKNIRICEKCFRKLAK